MRYKLTLEYDGTKWFNKEIIESTLYFGLTTNAMCSSRILREQIYRLFRTLTAAKGDMFKSLNPTLWKECGQNPVLLLERLSYETLEELAKDEAVLARINKVYKQFRAYMDVKPNAERPSVAYFCMEYAFAVSFVPGCINIVIVI